jgi:hypothetical protein
MMARGGAVLPTSHKPGMSLQCCLSAFVSLIDNVRVSSDDKIQLSDKRCVSNLVC